MGRLGRMPEQWTVKRGLHPEIEIRFGGFHQQALMSSFRYSKLIVQNGMLIIVKSNVMPDIIVVIPRGKPAAAIWQGQGFGRQQTS
jgi:hypothetical protein